MRLNLFTRRAMSDESANLVSNVDDFFYLHEVMGKAVHLESEKIQRCKIKIMGDSKTTCICQLTSKYSVCNLYANAFTFNLILMTKFERA